MATATRITNNEDILDSRDLVERSDDLEGIEDRSEAEQEEFDSVVDILLQLRDVGQDSPEDGLTLIRDSYFQEYAQELAEDIGAVKHNMTWPMNCIDWEEAA